MNYKLSRKDILIVDVQADKKGNDFATVTFKDGEVIRHAWVKNLKDKPGDMEIKDWCLTILNTHYLIREEEKKRGPKPRSPILRA